ncbi:MAG: hypothetical protein Q9170_007005 [Blastenia crenularia]
MKLPSRKSKASSGFCPEIPDAFGSLEEARNSLDYQWNCCLRESVNFEHLDRLKEGTEQQEHRDAYEVKRLNHKKTYQRWLAAFQAFLDANVTNMDSKAMQGAIILKLGGHTAAMFLDISAFEMLHYQTCFDGFLHLYKQVVDLATIIIDTHSIMDTPASVRPIFQMDHTLVGPLFVVVHRCRDPHLRRRALALLYKVPRQEGIWNSVLTARVAERIIDIEEEGCGEVTCCADVPDWKRISDIEVSFDLVQRRGTIRYSRLRSLCSVVREPINDILEW